MESTKTTNDLVNESTKAIEKIFSGTNEAMTEMYNKQIELTMSFYNNLLNSSLGNNNMWNQNRIFPYAFASLDTTKWFPNPFTFFLTNIAQNPFLQQMDETMMHIMEFNQNLFSAFANGGQRKRSNIDFFMEEYQQILNARGDASRQILSSMVNVFNEQLNCTIEMNKKVMDEITKDMEPIMKHNQKLWMDFFKIFQMPVSANEEKTKEHSVGEIKKRSHSAVPA